MGCGRGGVNPTSIVESCSSLRQGLFGEFDPSRPEALVLGIVPHLNCRLHIQLGTLLHTAGITPDRNPVLAARDRTHSTERLLDVLGGAEPGLCASFLCLEGPV